jgi:hypothetical protein
VEKRIQDPEGRRSGDALLTRVGKIIVILGAVATAFAFVNRTLGQVNDSAVKVSLHTAQIDSVKTDIAEVKQTSAGTLYLACVNFAETHPATQVPTFCNGATRANNR